MLRVPSARLRLERWIEPDGRRSCRDCGIGVIFRAITALISKHPVYAELVFGDDSVSSEPMAGGTTMKNFLVILLLSVTTVVSGQEFTTVPADQLGIVDENLVGVWETEE